MTGTENEELTREMKWLQERYHQYESPPTWPFDARVKARLGGALVAMLSALVTSLIIPMITGLFLPGG